MGSYGERGAPGEGRAQPSGCTDKGRRRSWACAHLPPLPVGAGSGTGFQVPAENGVRGWPGHGITILVRASATWPDVGRRTVGSGKWAGLPGRGCGYWMLHRAGAGV